MGQRCFVLISGFAKGSGYRLWRELLLLLLLLPCQISWDVRGLWFLLYLYVSCRPDQGGSRYVVEDLKMVDSAHISCLQ